jgi:hypothetical protein
MKIHLVGSTLLFILTMLCAHSVMAAGLKPTTFSMLCYIDSQEDKWTFRDFGFTLTYKDVHGKKQTLTANSTGTKKNCTDKSVSVTALIPASSIIFHINDFAGQAGSTVECTNAIKYKLAQDAIGKTCEFIVKSPKFGSYTSSSDCSVVVDCNGKLPKPS